MDEETLEIRSVIIFLAKQGLSNHQIFEQIIGTYGEGSVSLRTVERRTKALHEGKETIFDLPKTGRPPIQNLTEVIAEKMAADPATTTKELAELFHVDRKTVKRILQEELHMMKVNFRWIPHALNIAQRRARVEGAQNLLRFLTDSSDKTLNRLLTEDETWIYFENPRKSMWILNGSEIPTIPKTDISSKKVMIAVFWSRQGIKSITMLPRGGSFDREFFIQHVIGDLSKKCSLRNKIFHFDNARPHLIDDYLEEKNIHRLPHPPYSPDIAPSDFFLFGYLKMKLEGRVFRNEKELFQAVTEILLSIPKETFFDVFNEWIQRLKIVIDREGDYVL